MRTLVAVAVTLSICGLASADSPKPPATVAGELDRQLSWLERDLVPAAEAMPDGKYDFAPTQGDFKGVRTFALQVKHIAHTNFEFFSLMLGEKLANFDPKEENGPEKMKAKSEIVKYLKDSFALGHRAMKTLSEANLTERLGEKKTWTRLAAASLTVWHSYDHYGQMVEYLRMNGIVPPASRQNGQ